MKILVINKFLFPKGGDAISALNTGRLLSDKGHEVSFWGMIHPANPVYPYREYFIRHVDFERPGSLTAKLRAGVNLLYSLEAKRKAEELVLKVRPDIVHLHNFAHQISPSILHVFKKHKIPVVMTMHDYKLVCASYSMLANGEICGACKGGRHYHCLLKRCVKGSRVKSLLNTLEMYLHHDILHVYDLIDIFISPSMFLKGKVEEMGFKGKISYLANFVDLGEYEPRYEWQEKSIVYSGRLSKEKGLVTLLEAMKEIPDLILKIIGEGPLRLSLEQEVRSWEPGVRRNIKFLGYMRGEELKEEIRKAMFVVLPSEWYENNPYSVIEAFALGKPVIGARMGGIPELVRDGVSGFYFQSRDSRDLRDKIKYLSVNTEKIASMGKNARALVEEEFCVGKHYNGLMEIYREAAQNHVC